MDISVPLLEYTGDLLNLLIKKKLDELLLAASKYNTIPVGVLQFLISRINLQPLMVLSVYDNKSFMKSICMNDSILNSAMTDSLPDVAIPTVIIYPSHFKMGDIIYNYADLYYYSSLYLVDLKQVREGIKEGAIVRYILYTDSEARKKMDCEIECTKNIGLVKLPTLTNLPIRLPFRNITKMYPIYAPIIQAIMSNWACNASEEEINEIFTALKQDQTYDYNGIKLFKDFIKQKPVSLTIYSNFDNDFEPGHTIKIICLKMGFNTKLTHLLFYRYVDKIVDTITGSLEEVREKNGE
jgi:hypothetical protein